MNHLKIYNKLTHGRQSLDRKKYEGIYYEKHHIIPKCMGGDNSYNNLVLLTPREHFLAHWLLAKAYPRNFKLQCAWNSFCMSCKNRPISRYYEYARLNFIKHLISNEDRKLKNSITVSQQRWVNDGVISTRVHYEIANTMIKDGWNLGRLSFKRSAPTKETKEKISNGNSGKIVSEETRKKHSINGKSKIWVNNGIISKFINKFDLEKFKDGWVEGRIIKGSLKKPKKIVKPIKGSIWVYKNSVNNRIPLDELEKYIMDGWIKGRYLTEEVKESLRFHASKKEN